MEAQRKGGALDEMVELGGKRKEKREIERGEERDDMKKTTTKKTGQEGTIDRNRKERSIVLDFESQPPREDLSRPLTSRTSSHRGWI